MDRVKNHTNQKKVLLLQYLSKVSQTRFKIWVLRSFYEDQIPLPCMFLKSIHLLRRYIKHILYRPELHAPPPLTPQGEVVQPIPEKSFLQKYWMYIAALLLIFRMSFMGSSPSLNSIFFSSSPRRWRRRTTKKSRMSPRQQCNILFIYFEQSHIMPTAFTSNTRY